MTPAVAAICRIHGLISSHFNFHLLPARFSATGLYCPVMSETAQPKRGGKAFHSILEAHFDFIHKQRQRRKTWEEIAKLLLTEKGINVTLYAPYRFYRRKLKRASNWENAGNDSRLPPAHPDVAASRPQSRPSPLPQPAPFKQPDISTIKKDQFT